MSSLPPSVRSAEAAPGFPVFLVDHPACRAKVSPHGAHLMEWTPAGETPVIYLSPASALKNGAPIRGGIPVCWPWFGPHPSDAGKAIHGFVRNLVWDLVSCEETGESVVFRFELTDSEATRAQWDHAFHLTLELHLGKELRARLTTRNTGNAPISFTEALHTYLTAPAEEVEIHGLDGCAFAERAGGGNVPGTQQGNITIRGEVDRIYQSTGTVTVDDGGRTIEIRKNNSANTVVWNPGVEKNARLADLPPDAWRHFLCIEAANTAGHEITVPPGASHELETTVLVRRG